MKGIAISAVIVQHIGQAFRIGLVNPLGPIGVFLFLFLSGYGLSCSYQRNGRINYFRNRIIKVYLPYVIAVLFFLVWAVCMQKELTVELIGQYFLFISLPQGSYWYLILMFYWYGVFYLLTYCYDNDRILVPAMLLASFAIVFARDFDRNFVWQIFSFPAGVLVGKYRDCMKSIPAFLKNKAGGGVH